MGMGEMTNSYKTYSESLQGDRLFWRYRYRRDGNIKIDMKKYCLKMWTGIICLRIDPSGGEF
jgi:hypothetical protein